MSRMPAWVAERIAGAERLWLFLDYDGTLADFAPTPEHIHPDPALIGLLRRLVQEPDLRVAVVSGRRLSHVERLVPVPGILLAGSYGIELCTPEGERVSRLEYDAIRPALDNLKPQWQDLIAGRGGFFLEDKGWTLALHARFAQDQDVEPVLSAAKRMAVQTIERSPPELYRLLGGHRFLEIGPKLADKGQSVAYLLAHYPCPGCLPIYLGDDDKDEEAFRVVNASGGIAVRVAPEPRATEAAIRLDSPMAARRWLESLLRGRTTLERATTV